MRYGDVSEWSHNVWHSCWRMRAFPACGASVAMLRRKNLDGPLLRLRCPERFQACYQEHRAATKAIAQKKGGHFPRIVRAAPLRLVQIATARLYLSQLPECGEALVAGGRVRKPFLGFCLPRREPGVCLELKNEFSAGLCVDHWLRCPIPAGRFDPCDLARREMRNDGFDLAAPNGRFEDEA